MILFGLFINSSKKIIHELLCYFIETLEGYSIYSIYQNECSVTGCYSNFKDDPKKVVFRFPADPDLSRKWIEFLNREDFEVTTFLVMFIDHFEERFITQHPTRSILNYSMNPIPTILPSFIPLSIATVLSKPRNPPEYISQMN